MTPARATIYYNKERYGISIDMTMPQALLEKSVGKRVSLLLKDGRVMEGKLVGFDDLMRRSRPYPGPRKEGSGPSSSAETTW